MTISEKLEHNGLSEVRFYKEGVFWIAYEHSAYYVWLQKAYKPTRKYVKCVGSDVVSIGFPDNALNIFEEKGASRLPDNANVCVLTPDSPVDEQSFAEWRKAIPLQEASARTKPEEASAPATDIVELLKQFPLDRKTPIECMQFLSEIKSLVSPL